MNLNLMNVDVTTFSVKIRRALKADAQQIRLNMMAALPDYRLGLVMGYFLGKGIDPSDFVSVEMFHATVHAMASPAGDLFERLDKFEAAMAAWVTGKTPGDLQALLAQHRG